MYSLPLEKKNNHRELRQMNEPCSDRTDSASLVLATAAILGEPPRPRGRRASGFTLIELLIGFTLTAIILMLLFNALHLASRAWDTTEALAERNSDLRAVHNFLRRKLRQTQPLAWHVEGSPGENFMLIGEEQSLTFVAPAPAFLGPRGLHLLALALIKPGGDQGSELMLRWQPYREVMPKREEETLAVDNEALVAEGIDELRFSYFGADQSDDEPRWTDVWDDPDLLPQLVRVEIAKDGEDWPALVVDLHQ